MNFPDEIPLKPFLKVLKPPINPFKGPKNLPEAPPKKSKIANKKVGFRLHLKFKFCIRKSSRALLGLES